MTSDPALLTKAFVTFVRPILENGTTVFCPFMKQDIVSLERVQKCFTRRVCKRANITYHDYFDRLRLLKLKSLEYRRVYLDLCLLYKLYYEHITVSFKDFFQPVSFTYTTRVSCRNSCQLKPLFNVKTKTLNNLFFFRVINVWNSLSDYIVRAPSFLAFKQRLKKVDLYKFCVYK